MGRPSSLEIIPIPGIGEVAHHSDIAQLILDACRAVEIEWQARDVVVVTHKIVSKAAGRVVAVHADRLV